ncbi:beta-lactamase family protein [Altererythrobacter sp. BO-6]|uniref:serine hydrolase domain-containing protein n=1 Tax=Altererythrobacter sp. BO-6 TaxID=2604537 RepID=UPI001F496425|nr:beta-lactamase family protein [Altererythrobacter sp. BO-6]
MTIAELLSHQAGLSAFADPTSVDDFVNGKVLAGKLAQQSPLWPPGSRSGYHAITIGFLAAELFRRIEGRSLSSFVEQELTPFDIHIGISDAELGRVANVIPPAGMTAESVVPELDELQAATLGNPPLEPEAANTKNWRRAEIPSANGFANARGLAGLYSSLLRGAPEARFKLSSETLKQATEIRWSGTDAILDIEANWAAGFLRNSLGIYGPHAAAFGHSGWGGSFAFADPESGLAFAYVMNAMGTELVGDPRTLELLKAVYS